MFSLNKTHPMEMANEKNVSASVDPEAARKRNEWFTTSPDPWQEIVGLEHEGDRTFASTVNRMVVSAEPAQHAAMEAKLIGALAQPGLTEAGRLFICRMLGLIGSVACVPAVTPLLGDDRTAHAARIALDGIEDASVDAAYRSALGKLSGAAKAGLIGSIARRRDPEAVHALTAIAMDTAEDKDVRASAERAVEQLSAKI
jgi:hypothetical protein